MRPLRSRLTVATALAPLAAVAVLATSSTASAQQFPAFGGFEARVGAASPEDAGTGFSVGADFDLGSLGTERLRTLLGATYFAADVERSTSGGTPVGGSLGVIGGRVGLRFDLVEAARLTPFLLAQVGGYQVDAGDVDDPTTEDLLQGFVVGAGVGGGLAWRWSETGRSSLVLEGRQVAANNLTHWAVELGLRYGPRGRGEYDATTAALEAERRRIEAERVRSLQQQEEARVAANREQLRADSIAAVARQDQARTSQQAEEERLRLERERAAAERAAAAERERLQSAARAADEARLRAEREAAAAQAERMQAEAAAREAAERAAAAERQLQSSLEELDRVIANVSGVRQTERGMLLTLGQGLFATGQYELSTAARADVGRIAAVLGRYPDRTILVEGHTDAQGSESTNQTLSERRANSVRAALIAEGVNPARITATGYGESRPVDDNTTASGRAQNRRVEIVIPQQ